MWGLENQILLCGAASFDDLGGRGRTKDLQNAFLGPGQPHLALWTSQFEGDAR